MDFIFNDSTKKNEYGFVVNNLGIDVSEFLQNPVCLYEHEDDYPSIGRWSNLRIEGSKYIATLTFDEADPFAAELKRKYEGGFMSACSKSFCIEEYELIEMGGEVVPVVTKCRLKEISLVNVGANPSSVKLSLPKMKKGDIFKLSYDFSKSSKKREENFNTKISMKKVFLALGISESATEEQAVSAINKLLAEKSELQQSFDEFKAKVQAEKVDTLITEGIKSKKITALEGEKLKKLALVDFESVKDIIDAKQPYKPAKELIEEANAKEATAEGQKKERPTVFKPSGKSMQERMAKELAN